MANGLSEIKRKLDQLNASLNSNDSTHNSIRILELTREIVVYLKAHNSLSDWSKDHIFRAVGAINFKFFQLSLKELSQAVCNEHEISETNIYHEEIIGLSAEKLINDIGLIKTF